MTTRPGQHPSVQWTRVITASNARSEDYLRAWSEHYDIPIEYAHTEGPVNVNGIVFGERVGGPQYTPSMRLPTGEKTPRHQMRTMAPAIKPPSGIEHLEYMGSYIDTGYRIRECDELGSSDWGRILNVRGVNKNYYKNTYKLPDNTKVLVYTVKDFSTNWGLVHALNCSYVLYGLSVYESVFDESVQRILYSHFSNLFVRPECIIYPYDPELTRVYSGIAIWNYDPSMTNAEFILSLKGDSSATSTYTGSESPPAGLMMIDADGNPIPYKYVPSKAYPPTDRASRRYRGD
jgi:hypothetical protein